MNNENTHKPETEPEAIVQRLSWLTPNVRRWAYAIITALMPLLVAYGVLEDTTAPLWVALAASILGTTTAYMHTPTGGRVS